MLFEPDPPDFDRLPSDAKARFERHLQRLPVARVRSRVGTDALMLNEYRFVDRFASDHHLSTDQLSALGTWYMRATHDAISAARPDLSPPRPAPGIYVSTRPRNRADRLQVMLVRLRLWNLLNGTYTWIRNRCIDVRAATLRRRNTA